jgi:hypothetical protein
MNRRRQTSSCLSRPARGMGETYNTVGVEVPTSSQHLTMAPADFPPTATAQTPPECSGASAASCRHASSCGRAIFSHGVGREKAGGEDKNDGNEVGEEIVAPVPLEKAGLLPRLHQCPSAEAAAQLRKVRYTINAMPKAVEHHSCRRRRSRGHWQAGPNAKGPTHSRLYLGRVCILTNSPNILHRATQLEFLDNVDATNYFAAVLRRTAGECLTPTNSELTWPPLQDSWP